MRRFPPTLLPVLFPSSLSLPAESAWPDIPIDAGIGQQSASRLKFADLNNDHWPDIIILPEIRTGGAPTVLLHAGAISPVHYLPFPSTGLPPLRRGDILAFADLNNDGNTDAIIGRYLDIYQEDYTPPADEPTRTAWLPGNGDGTFAPPRILDDAQLATTCAIAVGDVNQDGLPDILLGNWYERYFSGFEGFSNDLLLQYGEENAFARWPVPDEGRITDFHDDLGGRPTYGVALPRLDDGLPMLLELNYGRRWNRLYKMEHRRPLREIPGFTSDEPLALRDPRALADHVTRNLRGENIAADAGVDGDSIRHGRHPEWPADHAEASPRSRRPDEPPFRANGNTFDAAIGDIDNDGDFDLFLSTIIHAWAGESSDRSRFLVNQLRETGELKFLSFEELSVDRIPELPPPGEPLQPEHTRYNQGDIYAELADLNNDGRLDLILCSSDYPDPPPHDERLRIYFQQADGRFLDVTAALGIDHVGAGMPSLADVDGDGDLDLIVGQGFNRLPDEQRRAAALTSGALKEGDDESVKPRPLARLFQNNSPDGRRSLTLKLVGDPASGATHAAYGTIVKLAADLDGDPSTPLVVQMRQVMGPHGHSGKQHATALHFGLGEATEADWIEIHWPAPGAGVVTLERVAAGHYLFRQSDNTLEPVR